MKATHPPPSLLSRTLAAAVVGVALLLSLVFITLSINTCRQVRENVATLLESTQRVVAELEALRQRQLQEQASMLAESPTLKAAIDTYTREGDDEDSGDAFIATVASQLTKVGAYVAADIIALVDRRGRTLVAVGPLAAEWPKTAAGHLEIHPAGSDRHDGVAYVGARAYRTAWVELWLDDTVIGTLYLSTLLDDAYAGELGHTAGTQTAIVDRGRQLAKRERQEHLPTFEAVGV